MADSSALSAISSSNMSNPVKSSIGKMFASIAGDSKNLSRLRRHVEQAGHTTRLYAETALVGAALGAIHAANPQVGLDVIARPAMAATDPKNTSGKAKDAVTVPMDLVLAVVAGAGGMALAGEGVEGISADLRNVGGAALAVFSFRKSADVVAAKLRHMGKPSGGTVPSLVSMQREATASMHGDEYSNAQFGRDSRDPILVSAAAL
jgi:hypothetical protein